MMVKLNGCIFWLKMMTYLTNAILFGVKSVPILKKNLIANLSTIKPKLKNKTKILKTKIKSCVHKTTDFQDKEILR